MFSTGTTWFRAAVATFLHPSLSQFLFTPSCLWTMFVSPECLSCTRVPLLPNYWLLVCAPQLLLTPLLPSAQLASAHLSEFNISLGRGLQS